MSHPNTAEAQRSRLLAALKRGPVDTVHAYRNLDILHVPRRVFELRKAGYAITTSWASRVTERGYPHRVGIYSLAKAEAGTC
ncbi:helix-turn-helix domain-containing protein [Cupriavidus sp. CV2]|uniref:helix-turn-helix domain-containing protein n=1 Tax=Cupriavidus ulmosensis TaxID=3065913 RepID=UPI00296B038E|nr:helix-turn-helix domain-containing protein [Cupriavidus sp. CV2]MDW3684005.1 helix-turn-helix domain-containing protein [Cupriavidus sp. CV2]